jgi:thiamine biosynthesis protein ThiS
MEISVNGQKRSFTAPLTITGMLEMLGVNPKAVVVERNFQIVARPEMEAQSVEDGDAIEIIRLVGGG